MYMLFRFDLKYVNIHLHANFVLVNLFSYCINQFGREDIIPTMRLNFLLACLIFAEISLS